MKTKESLFRNLFALNPQLNSNYTKFEAPPPPPIHCFGLYNFSFREGRSLILFKGKFIQFQINSHSQSFILIDCYGYCMLQFLVSCFMLHPLRSRQFYQKMINQITCLSYGGTEVFSHMSGNTDSNTVAKIVTFLTTRK